MYWTPLTKMHLECDVGSNKDCKLQTHFLTKLFPHKLAVFEEKGSDFSHKWQRSTSKFGVCGEFIDTTK